jgi:hypothetical protein
MGQYMLMGMSGPWLRRGEGGDTKEILFMVLVRTVVSGATGNNKVSTSYTQQQLFSKTLMLFMFSVIRFL